MNTLPIIQGIAQTDDMSFDTTHFSIAYQNYIASNNNSSETVMNSIRNNSTMIKLQDAYNKLSIQTKENALYENFIEGGPNSGPLHDYNTSVVPLKTELSEKIKKLSTLQTENDYDTKYNSTMLTSTLVTIGGSCILYYVFMHLQ